MNDLDVLFMVSNWGEKIDGSQSGTRTCRSGDATEGCMETHYKAISGSYQLMASLVVGFTKDAPFSSSCQGHLAVICECPGCHKLFWYHITIGMLPAYVGHCPCWPADQKTKFRKATE